LSLLAKGGYASNSATLLGGIEPRNSHYARSVSFEIDGNFIDICGEKMGHVTCFLFPVSCNKLQANELSESEFHTKAALQHVIF
jgi:hypothetical protein